MFDFEKPADLDLVRAFSFLTVLGLESQECSDLVTSLTACESVFSSDEKCYRHLWRFAFGKQTIQETCDIHDKVETQNGEPRIRLVETDSGQPVALKLNSIVTNLLLDTAFWVDQGQRIESRYARRSSLNHQDCEDVIADVMFKLFIKSHEDGFTIDGNPEAFSVKMIQNLVGTIIKKKKRELHVLQRKLEKERGTRELEFSTHEEFVEFVGKMLSLAPQKTGGVLFLHFTEMWGAQQISDCIEESDSTVRTWIERGKKELPKYWAAYDRR